MKKLLAVLLMEISSPGAAWEGKHAALLDISVAAQRQAGLFGGGRDHTRLMQVMDSINATWARSTWPPRACARTGARNGNA